MKRRRFLPNLNSSTLAPLKGHTRRSLLVMNAFTRDIRALEFIQTGAILRFSLRDIIGVIPGKTCRHSIRGESANQMQAQRKLQAISSSRVAAILRFALRDVVGMVLGKTCRHSTAGESTYQMLAQKRLCAASSSRVATIPRFVLRDFIGMVPGSAFRHSIADKSADQMQAQKRSPRSRLRASRYCALLDGVEEPFDGIVRHNRRGRRTIFGLSV
jgi:hypothetical protein